MKSTLPIILIALLVVTGVTAGDPKKELSDRLTRTPSIQVLPTNLKAGDQAILVIESFFDKPNGQPITLKATGGGDAIKALELWTKSSYEKGRSPENSDMRIYRISLKKTNYTFAPTDFEGLPEGFKFPKLNIYRE
jgi:hypothetical protein